MLYLFAVKNNRFDPYNIIYQTSEFLNKLPMTFDLIPAFVKLCFSTWSASVMSRLLFKKLFEKQA